MSNTKINAKLVLASRFKDEIIYTLELVMPRMILSEFNTHRAFSRNSASSRAIPLNKMVKVVATDPFIPVKWIKSHKGMQGYEYFEDEADIINCRTEWLKAKEYAVMSAKRLDDMGVTKQFCNRLLEPFMWHKVIMTTTQDGLNNFFKLRLDESAEIHIQILAREITRACSGIPFQELNEGDWHIPYANDLNDLSLVDKLFVSTARCARISYTTIGDSYKIDVEKDIELTDKLILSGHMSPLEHCAYADSNSKLGNLNNFTQFRHCYESIVQNGILLL